MASDRAHHARAEAIGSGIEVKSRDAAWTVFVIDPIAVPVSAALDRVRWITPDLTTALSAVVAIVAGVLLAYGHMLAGALVYQLSFLLDCVDGKLAGLRGAASPHGQLYDVAADCVRVVATAAGLAIGLTDTSQWAALSVGAYLAVRFSLLLIANARPPEDPPSIVHLPASAPSTLRAARSRSKRLGTSVDAEAVAFTLGPAFGVPVAGLAVAALMDFAHIVAIVIAGARSGATS